MLRGKYILEMKYVNIRVTKCLSIATVSAILDSGILKRKRFGDWLFPYCGVVAQFLNFIFFSAYHTMGKSRNPVIEIIIYHHIKLSFSPVIDPE
jgi:hypothetical protein